jgi:hypothetical protein
VRELGGDDRVVIAGTAPLDEIKIGRGTHGCASMAVRVWLCEYGRLMLAGNWVLTGLPRMAGVEVPRLAGFRNMRGRLRG